MRVTAITPIKNEGPFILEWLAYHLLIGVNDFITFTNDCEDGTDAILARLDELGLVRHLPNPSILSEASGDHRQAALDYAQSMMALRPSDWVVNLDLDEYICVKTGNGRLKDLFAACEGADFISMNLLTFGSAGVESFEPKALTIGQYVRAMALSDSPYSEPKPREVKTLMRGDAPVNRYGLHAPEVSRDDLSWVNGSGQKIDAKTYKGGIETFIGAEVGYDLVQVNHYALRSIENFLVKTARGDIDDGQTEDVRYWRRYWSRFDENLIENRRIQRFIPYVKRAVSAMLNDKELAGLYEESVLWHKAKIQQLKDAELQSGLLATARRRYGRKLTQERAVASELAPPAQTPLKRRSAVR